jgi:hypothetical protein
MSANPDRPPERWQWQLVREAAEAGLLTRHHLNVIDRTLAEAPAADREKVETALLADAPKFEGRKFEMLAKRILLHLDQDGKAPDDRELAYPKREFHYDTRRDGSVVFRGYVDPESGAKLAALMGRWPHRDRARTRARPPSGTVMRSRRSSSWPPRVTICRSTAESDRIWRSRCRSRTSC